jgi:3-dehydroquinate synthase
MPARFSLTIASSRGEYDVQIGDGTFEALLAERPQAPVIADAFFAERLAPHASRTLLLTAEEGQKTLTAAERLIEQLRDLGTTRGDALVAVGGGIVQDVATAAASLYMRGLQWSYAPTTLLGMVDSCIGGKSSLNVGHYKNLAGNFHPPVLVVIDPSFIDTLPMEDRAGGMCEAMKISYCRGPEAFARYLELYEAGDPAALIHHALAAKKWFIEIDEFDQAERRLLNFGHTFGHALEAATQFAVGHGTAVGLGVLAAEAFADHPAPELAVHAHALIAAAPELAARLERRDRAVFEAAVRSDKKHSRGHLHLIVPTAGGGIAEQRFPRDDATIARVNAAMDEAIATVSAS